MDQWQIPQQLGSSSLTVVFLNNGQVAFCTREVFPTTFDTSPSGQSIIISKEDLLVGSERILYNTAINLSEEVRGWLKSFNMLSPV
jgi:hypothetical protein